MSALRESVEKALGAWVSEKTGGFVTSFYVIVEFVDRDGDDSWAYESAENQNTTKTMGLLEWAREVCKVEQRAHLDQIWPNDEK